MMDEALAKAGVSEEEANAMKEKVKSGAMSQEDFMTQLKEKGAEMAKQKMMDEALAKAGVSEEEAKAMKEKVKSGAMSQEDFMTQLKEKAKQRAEEEAEKAKQ